MKKKYDELMMLVNRSRVVKSPYKINELTEDIFKEKGYYIKFIRINAVEREVESYVYHKLTSRYEYSFIDPHAKVKKVMVSPNVSFINEVYISKVDKDIVIEASGLVITLSNQGVI